MQFLELDPNSEQPFIQKMTESLQYFNKFSLNSFNPEKNIQ